MSRDTYMTHIFAYFTSTYILQVYVHKCMLNYMYSLFIFNYLLRLIIVTPVNFFIFFLFVWTLIYYINLQWLDTDTVNVIKYLIFKKIYCITERTSIGRSIFKRLDWTKIKNSKSNNCFVNIYRTCSIWRSAS